MAGCLAAVLKVTLVDGEVKTSNEFMPELGFRGPVIRQNNRRLRCRSDGIIVGVTALLPNQRKMTALMAKASRDKKKATDLTASSIGDESKRETYLDGVGILIV